MKFMKLTALLLVSLLSFGNAAVAQEAKYKIINPPQPTSTEGKIEVVEVFSYACSHCFRFDPIVNRWEKGIDKDVAFVRLPAIFNAQLALYARAFYAAEALGVLDKLHTPLFNAIHMEKRALNSEEQLVDFAGEVGIDKDKFAKAFRSFSVGAKVRRAAELGKRYGVSATPSMVVNGKYLLDPSMTGGFKGLLNEVDELVKQERKVANSN